MHHARKHQRRIPRISAAYVAVLSMAGGCRESWINPRHCLVDDGTLRASEGGEPNGASPLKACSNDWDCPRGTQCSSDVCLALAFPADDENSLVRGFGVDEMELHVELSQSGNVYVATIPSESATVVCGLFVSPPVVEGGDHGRIANDWKSLYRSHLYKLSGVGTDAEGSRSIKFYITDLSDRYTSDNCPNVTGAWGSPSGASNYPLITTLQVACWSYGKESVIAASRLRNVPISDLPEVKPLVTDCAGPDGTTLEGRYCVPQGELGVCQDNQCTVHAVGEEAGARPTDTIEDAAVADNVSAENILLDAAVQSIPLASCADAGTGALCVNKKDFVGRCIGSRCSNVALGGPIDLPLVVSSCDAAASNETTDWLNCYNNSIQGYGTCYKNGCLSRCVADPDCASVSGDSTYKCGHYQGKSYLGLCGSQEAIQALLSERSK
jgi:hypothetical protein